MNIPDLFTNTTTVQLRPIHKAALAALVILVVLIVYSYARALGDADSGLYGLWQIDSDFAERADIDSMYLFISPPKGLMHETIGLSGQTCGAYAVIKSGGDTLFASALKVDLRRTSIRVDTTHAYSATFSKPMAIIPKVVRIEYDAVTSCLTMSVGKTMYARMFKRPEASYYCSLDAEKCGVPTTNDPVADPVADVEPPMAADADPSEN